VWAEATADGLVGNCAEAGVLGPVPGAFGALQALLTLKILLKMRGQLDGELLLMDFTAFTSTKLKAPRRRECVAPRCAVVRELERDDADIEVALDSLEEAARAFRLIDVRTPEEFAVRPTAARHVPMPALLADPGLLAENAPYLLVCASGKRSLAAARELRKLGRSVHSLAGGLQGLKH
jgi:adenylyltransferase/sulfurtransferase